MHNPVFAIAPTFGIWILNYDKRSIRMSHYWSLAYPLLFKSQVPTAHVEHY